MCRIRNAVESLVNKDALRGPGKEDECVIFLKQQSITSQLLQPEAAVQATSRHHLHLAISRRSGRLSPTKDMVLLKCAFLSATQLPFSGHFFLSVRRSKLWYLGVV